MSWRTEKTRTGQDFVYDGVEFGISPSPTKGTANMQNVNISTESGEVMASYTRTAQQQTALSNQTLTPSGATNFTGPSTLKAGTWISVSASTVSGISVTTSPSSVTADYLVVGGGGSGGQTNSSVRSIGGGGGGGEVKTGTNAFSIGSTVITVDTGAALGTSTGTTGGSSSIGSVSVAAGGGGGGSGFNPNYNGLTGANGGGGGADNGSNGTGGVGSNKTGGNGVFSAGVSSAGGGGAGNGANGSNGSVSTGGAGGAGTASSISGSSVTYGGGGGGGGFSAFGAGGAGGGGNGGYDSNGVAGTANTGGGGGGAGDNGSARNGGAGGSGIAIISYTTGSMVAFGGNITFAGGKTIHTFLSTGVFTVVSIAKTNLYYVSYASGTTFKLSTAFDPTGANAITTHGTTGSVTFSTVTTPNSMVAKATEKYTTSTATKYRYYLLDVNGYVWVRDTAINETYGTQWMLPDPNNYSTLSLTGMSVLNGWLFTVGVASIYGKPTVDLGRFFNRLDNCWLNEPFPTHKNFAMTGNQGKMYYCDGNYIGEVFATTSLVTSIANIQSNSSYTASSTTGTISAVINGSLPYSGDGTRIPAVFFTDAYGTQPTNLTVGVVYYIKYIDYAGTFEVYSALTAGSAINIATGAAGNQYFNTFWPFGTQAGINGTVPTVQFSGQRVNLPANETAQCMAEIDNTVLIGGSTNTVYPWNQVDATPSGFIELPESNVKNIINVNNTAYVFAGNKGNIYVTNTSIASLMMKVPDYCAGVPGTPLTYIEPTFTWGDADYVRGRVYFSILDQTATKAGNTGGIWSFVPSQNIDPSQEVGMALRLENQNSYGDYDGYATIILPNQEQTVTSPQYWTAWQDSYTTGTSTFGIDGTGTTPVTTYVIETDILPSGTFLDKGTFQQLEYKLTTPMTAGDSVQIYYRLNSTDAWTTCDTVIEESDRISGYFDQHFQKTQWVQFRIVVTTGGTTASSFVRFKQLMLR